ncbi:hypothetical protein N0V88_000721 [Collariella sp. IMI 366227]|nr:hypothetical protein N0V88_000721 [Collariella sp. IMI 366227]
MAATLIDVRKPAHLSFSTNTVRQLDRTRDIDDDWFLFYRHQDGKWSVAHITRQKAKTRSSCSRDQ